MASSVYGTQLYNYDKEKIYPVSDANVVTCGLSRENSSTYDDVEYLFKKVAELSGEGEAVTGITISIAYKRSKHKIQSYIEGDDGWGETFINPNSEFPYLWKRTIISYKKAITNVTYEIVASANNEIVQTIYLAVSDNSKPEISYINPDTGEEDLHKYDNVLPEFWTETPAVVSSATPNVFMSTRKRIDGEWTKFSTPAQYGRWAYDSTIVMKYFSQTSSDIPSVVKTDEDPGSHWRDSNTQEFTGFLWMITATAVDGKLQAYKNIIWSDPVLLSIVK